MNGNLSHKDVSYVHVIISDIKRTRHHALIITNYVIWHQSLKSIHYRILLIFQTKKTTDLRVKTWGDKRYVIPPMSKHGGDTYPPSPPGFTPLSPRVPFFKRNDPIYISELCQKSTLHIQKLSCMTKVY